MSVSMKIQRKIFFLILILLTIFAISSFYIQKQIVYSKFVDIEYAEALDDTNRCVAAIKREQEGMARLLEDWATWDDTYQFLKDGNQEFIKENLLKETYSTTRLNLIYLVNTEGKVIWGKILVNGKPITLQKFPTTPWSPDNVYLVGNRTHQIVTGIVNTSRQPMLITAGRVVKSNFTGDSRGTLIMGRFLDSDLMKNFYEQTKVRFKFLTIGKDRLDPTENEVVRNIKPNKPEIIECASCNSIHAYITLPNFVGIKTFLIKATIPTKYMIVGNNVLWSSMISLLVTGAALLLAFSFFIRKDVVLPIMKVARYAGSINSGTDLSARLNLTRSGEINDLARELNNMMIRLETDHNLLEEMEEQLRTSNERHLNMIMNLPVGVYRHSTAQHPEFTLTNSAFLEIFDCETTEEFRYNSELSSWVESIKYLEFLENPERNGGLEFELSSRSGKQVYVKVWANIIEHDKQTAVEGILVDITNQKKAEANTRQLATLVDQTEEMILITDRDGYITYVNPSFSKITGYTQADLTGKRPVILSTETPEDMKIYEEIEKTLSTGKAWHGTLIPCKKNGERFTEQGSIFPLFDESGQVCNRAAIMRDMTEELKLEQQLRQSHKMQAIGTLAGGIAHDFNNILSAILGYANLAHKELRQNPEQTEKYVKKITIAGNRARDLVAQILTFSRQKQLKVSAVQFGLIVKEACNMLRASLPSSIEIRRYIKSQSMVAADPTQLHQIMLNLCTNASQSMDGYGTLTVSLEDVYITDRDAEELPGLNTGRHICLKVEDTGHGMDEDTQKRVFEPFFTTKEMGEGTGMGLSVVHGIVTSIGGAIKIRSRLEEGSTFTVYLPVAEGESYEQSPMEEEVDNSKLQGHERILFVDDERILVELNKETLEGYGYNVTGVYDSAEALEVFRESPNDFDIVVSDLTMPGMTGDVLVERLMKIRSDIPVIVCTGYNNVVSEQRMSELGICIVVHKPIIGKQLAETIRNVIDN